MIPETQVNVRLSPEPLGAKPRSGEPSWSAKRTLTRRQKVVFSLLALSFLATVGLAPLLAAQLALVAVTTLFLASIALRSLYVIVGLRAAPSKPIPLQDSELPTYTVVVALYREARVASQLCDALAAFDYPADKIQVILACEEHDVETVEACREHARSGWLVLAVPAGVPQTKPRALNAALEQATGDLITIYDAEDIPDIDQLRLAASGFASGGVDLGSLQARLDVRNETESVISRCFAIDYITLFAAVLPGLAELRQPMPLGGTSTHFRTAVIRELGGWDPWNVTEDCELGIRLATNGYRSDVLESTTMEEAVVTRKAWVNQRSRWVKGYAQTALVMLRRPLVLARELGPLRYSTGLLTVASVPLILLLQPFAIVLVGVYLVDVIIDGSSKILTPVFPEPLASIALVAFVAGFYFLIFSHMLAVHRSGRSGLVAYSLLIPVYLLLGSVAAWKGCIQLINRPHFWDKTSHGVSTQDGAAAGSLASEAAVDPATPPGSNLGSGSTAVAGEPADLGADSELAKRSTFAFDTWLFGLMGVSLLALSASAYLSRSDLLAYSDAPAHLNTAHRIFDNASPGIDQLGLHWLPLYHILEAPFARVDYLYRTGWAGSIASILAGLVAIGFFYRLARQCGASKPESATVGAAILAQSSFLYVSVVPMHYSLLIATATASIFYLARWCERRDSLSLVLCGVWVSLATLTHFDAWLLVPAEALVVATLAYRSRARNGLADDSIVWAVFAASGLGLFLFANIWWKGEPLAFLHAVSDGGDIIVQSHGGWAALLDHPRAVWELAGPLPTGFGVAGALIFAWRWRRRPSHLVALLLLYPLAFFAVQAATVGSLIEPASNVADWRNLRYAATMVPALTFFAVVGWSGWRGAAFAVAAVLIALGCQQMIRGHNPALAEARGDLPAGTNASLVDAGKWLRQNSGGEHVMVLRASLQERFELLSNLPGNQFLDDNDAAFQALAEGRSSVSSSSVGWLVRITRLDQPGLLTPIPKPLRDFVGKAPCVTFGSSSQASGAASRPLLSIWKVGGQC